jgi:hypothetical protein
MPIFMQSHPYYIKCRKTDVHGLAGEEARVCRTNEQWKEASPRTMITRASTLEGMARPARTNNN